MPRSSKKIATKSKKSAVKKTARPKTKARKTAKAKRAAKSALSPTAKIAVNIDEIEQNLPSKTERSHHVAVKIENVYKSFPVAKHRITVLKDISLNFYSGEFVIVYGPSGCGKSTFLHTILGLEKPSRGKVYLRKEDLYAMNNDERTNFRRQKIGMVFQQSNWIKSLSVIDNVAYPLWLAGWQETEARRKALNTLEEVGMKKHANYHPSELSGGQQQKVALARALSTNPWIIMADEPTGNLDSVSGTEVMTLMAKLNREKSRMIIMVTHDVGYLPLANRRIGMKDGAVIADEHD